MKVDGGKNIQIEKSRAVQQNKQDRLRGKHGRKPADSLSISADAVKIKEATELVMAGMDKVRTAKVKELKEKIASGSYPLDSRKIAEAMLDKEG